MCKAASLIRHPTHRWMREGVCLLIGLGFLLPWAVSAITGIADNQQFVFEPKGRILGKGSDPQLGARASGDLFLLHLRELNLWLHTSSDGGDNFDDGVCVNDGGEVMSHSENTPLMIVRSMHEFYVLWSGDDGHGRKTLRLARSMDWGKSFGKSIPIDQSSSASQSFYSMAVAPDGTLYVAWLDGRDRGQGKQGTSALYIAKSGNHGQTFEGSLRVALNVCPCCRPAIAFGEGKTLYVGWRGVLENNIRDVLLAASKDGGETFFPPTRVADDNWQINGCPHSGPSLATLDGILFASWRTVSGNRSRLYTAWSSDQGEHFSPKAEADANLLDANHPRLLRLQGTVGLVFQAREPSAQSDWGKLDIYFRQIDRFGAFSPLQRLSHAVGSATYPALLFESPEHLFLAWTERSSEGPNVVLARGRLILSGQMNPPPAGTAAKNLPAPQGSLP